MSPSEEDSLDEALADKLAAFLETHLAAGPHDGPRVEPDLPPDELCRFRLALDSLLRLEGVGPLTLSRASILAEGAPSLDLLTGAGRLGKFQIHRELGRGGCGIVFLATDTAKGCDVALKLPRLEGLLDSELRQRFLHEAQVNIGLDHPGLVPVYEAGEVGAICYIASAYVGESTLASWMGTRLDPVPVRTAVALIASLARAVEYLHEHQLLHRDIKPSNVLLSSVPAAALPDPDLAVAGVPRLTDFGLAKLMDATPPLAAQRGTTGGLVLGTAEYMAPEQADGRPEFLGRPTDVYALGAVLYELLTGQPPFRGRNKFDTLRKVLTEAPPPLRRLRNDVPRDVEAVCLQCLEKDPRRRYPTARQLAEDLQRHLAGERTMARPMSWWVRAYRWARRWPKAAVLLVLVALSPFGLAALNHSLAVSKKRTQAEELRGALFSAETTKVSPIVSRLREGLPFVEDELRAAAAEGGPPRERLRAALVLAPTDGPSARYLRQRALEVGAAELQMICDALAPESEAWVSYWAAVLHDPQEDSGRRLRAACILAQLTPESDCWKDSGDMVADLLAAQSPLTVLGWAQLLAPVKWLLLPHLEALFADEKLAVTRGAVTAVLAEYCDGNLPKLVGLLREAEGPQFNLIFDKLLADPRAAVRLLKVALAELLPGQAGEVAKERFARGQVNLALALVRLGATEPAFDYLRVRPDSRLRYFMLHSMRPCHVDAGVLAEGLRTTQDDSVRSALLLALGDYGPSVAKPLWDELALEISRLYRDNPDPGVHSAAGWVLDRWGVQRPPAEQTFDEARGKDSRWYTTTREGHTLAIVLPPVGALVSARPVRKVDEQQAGMAKGANQTLNPVGVAPFAIATHEVTVDQFRRFASDQIEGRPISVSQFRRFASKQDGQEGHSPEGRCPVTDVSYVHAAMYCNWLSKQEKIPEDQWCYHVTVGERPQDTKVEAVFHNRIGYRMPTEAEWEFASRAGTTTALFFGEDMGLLPGYAWYYSNSEGRTWPVGRLRPNPLGLFDIHGNAWEWCDRSWDDIPMRNEILRGGAWIQPPSLLRPELRTDADRSYRHISTGFRVARTLGASSTSD